MKTPLNNIAFALEQDAYISVGNFEELYSIPEITEIADPKEIAEYRENKLPARLLPVCEVARFLGVHSSTVRRWEKTGILKSYAIGLRHNLRFKQEDVLNFLDKCKKESAHQAPLNSHPDNVGHRIRLWRR